MTPDLPIPEEAAAAAIEDIAKALFPRYWGDYGRYVDPEPMRDMARAEARTALAAALPHLRSLQVETQVEYGRALGRKEAAEEIAEALEAIPATVYPEDIFPPDGTSVDCQSARVMRFAYPAAARIARDVISEAAEDTSEPRTDRPVGPSHPKDSQTAREAL